MSTKLCGQGIKQMQNHTNQKGLQMLNKIARYPVVLPPSIRTLKKLMSLSHSVVSLLQADWTMANYIINLFNPKEAML